MADETLTLASPPRPLGRGEAFGLLAAIVLMWGLNWPIMKIGLVSITPLWFSVARFALGAVVLFAWLAATGRLVAPARADWPVVLSVGLMQMATQTTLNSVGLTHVPAGRSAVLAYTVPIWVAPGAALFLGERLTRLKLAGLAFGLLGIAVLFNPLDFDWSHRGALVGNGVLMAGALAWAATILQIRGHRFHASPLQLAPWQMLLALVVLTPLALLIEGGTGVAWSGTLALIILYNGIVATALAFSASVAVTRTLPAITTSLGLIGVPIVGVASSTLFLGEPLTPSLIAALVLVIVGLVLITLADAKERRA
ncbi:MAG: DMT family transporter [Rhodospirillaceae bacterium]|nr:DMT family transporter [Rhodospirillaceae bacterium]